MATFVLFDEFGSELGKGSHDLSADTFRVALVAAANAPDQATMTALADLTQITGTYGYTQVSDGTGATITMTWAETGAGTGIWQFGDASSDCVFTASGGSIPTFRYAVIVNDSSTGNLLVGYLDYGSNVDVTDTNTFTIDAGSSGFFQLTIP